MHPAPPKREEDLAEHMEMWQDNVRRLGSHGAEFKFAPVFKIKKYFDLWEANKDHTDPNRSYEELLAKVEDHSRKKKLGSSAQERMQHGGDPMNAGVVGGWSWYDDFG